MEFLLNRFRNLTTLLLAILAQLVLLAYQVKSNGEVRLIRVWAVTAVTPLARVIEAGRGSVSRFFSDYFVLLDVREENKRMKRDLDRISMENQYLRTELGTADRAGAIFQQHSPSKTVAAHIIWNTTDSGAAVVVVDRGSTSGVQKGMAVETPAGIVGKVVNVYPMASMVLEITHPNFAAGVISQKNRVHGTLKGQGRALVIVDDVQNEQTIDPDEWFYTSGEDGVFPKGLPAGQVATVRAGKSLKEIYVTPSGFQNGLEEVLIIIEGVHAPIPGTPALNQPVYLLPPPLDSAATPVPAPSNSQPGPVSEADRVLDHYRKVGEVARHVYGDRGSGAPDYNINVGTKPPEGERSMPAASTASSTAPPRPGSNKTRKP
jgi:rod shape-determining protein MreC